jgi:hypothetical protein
MERYNPPFPAETLEEKKQQAIQQCHQLLNDFSKRADRHKGRYKRLQITSISLAVCTTLLSALSASKVLGQLDWIVPAVSGLATLSTTLLTQTNTQKMWVQSRNISQQFQTQLFLYSQCSEDYAIQDDSERLKLFSKRLMEIWSQAQEGWSQQASSGK